jgi:hypothetical protein
VFAGDDGGDIVCGHNSAFSRHHPPEFCKFIRPKNNRAQRDPQERAQGRAGARCTRGLMCQDAHSKKRTRAYRFSGSSPAFPAQWFTAYFVLSPARPELVCHRRQRDAKHHRQLDTGHWGVRTTRLCRPRQPRSSVAAFASIAPRPAFRDECAYAPLVGRDAQEVKVICLRDQARSLRHIGTTGKSAKCRQDLFEGLMCFSSRVALVGGRSEALAQPIPSNSSIMLAITDRPPSQNFGSLASRPNGLSSSE